MSLMPFLILLTFISLLFEKISLKSDRINYSMFFLSVIYGISLFWSEEFYILDFLSFFTFSLMFILIRSTTLSENEFKMIQIACIAGTTLLLLYQLKTIGISYMFLFEKRLEVGDYYSDPNGICARVYLGFALSFCNLIRAKKTAFKVLFFILCSCAFITVILTMSRGGFLGIFMFLMFLVSNSKSKRLLSTLFLLIIVFVAVYILFYSNLVSEKFLNKFYWETNSGSLDELSTGRIELWRIGLFNILPKMPIWGLGLYGSYGAIAECIGFRQTIHNTFLQYLLELGYFGFILYVMLIVCTLKSLKVNKDNERYSILMGVIVISSFLSSLDAKYLLFTILYCNIFYVINVDESIQCVDAPDSNPLTSS